jgi:hypothetical protein
MAAKETEVCETCGEKVALSCKGCAIVDKYEREHPNWADDNDGPTLEQVKMENAKRRLMEMKMDAYRNYVRPA